MNNVVNELTRSIVDKNSLQECSVNELEELTRQYPYFGPAQFLLARKLKEENSPLYEQQSQRAILFFQDQLWFDYLSGNDDVTVKITAASHEPVVQQRAATPVVTEEKIVAPVREEKIITKAPVIEAPVAAEPVTEEPVLEEPVTGEPIVEQHIIEESTIKEPILEEPFTEEPVIEQKQPKQPPVAEIVAEPERIIDPISGQDLSGPDEEEQQETTPEPAIKLPELKITPVDVSKALSFEPFHTVDYFASQGIRVKEEEKPKDKLSQQLRSFTEWLKTMKKLPESEIAAPAPLPSEDQQVTQMAEHSLKDREVVTEAMADVWEKQENYEKAIETYRKLSLLNPAKSSYFAAKIEQLKRR